MARPSASTAGVELTYRPSDSDMDTDSNSDAESIPVILGNTEEGKLSDIEQDVSLTEADQTLSEEQNYRETMSGLRSFMGWTHIPEVDFALSSSEDNPFASPKQQPASKTSLTLPTDWLCRKMDRLNLTLVQGYPSRSSEAGGLQRPVCETWKVARKVVWPTSQSGQTSRYGFLLALSGCKTEQHVQ